MTANKHFKRRVRERAARTGESYTAALRHLRHVDAWERIVQWQRVEKPEFGYAVHVPHGWEETLPNLKNSPWETARFREPADRRHSLIVFRGMPRPDWTAMRFAEAVHASLESIGFVDFTLTEVRFCGRDGALLACVKRDAGREWAVREYFAVRDGVPFTLGCGSAVPEEDDPLFAAAADRFELLDPT
jgi:hypothetical protein